MTGVAVHYANIGPVFCVKLSELHEVIHLNGLIEDLFHYLAVLVVYFCKGGGVEEFLDVKGGVAKFGGFYQFVLSSAFSN
mgnify:CR=1 FL=1